jgi:hypothetical protein
VLTPPDTRPLLTRATWARRDDGPVPRAAKVHLRHYGRPACSAVHALHITENLITDRASEVTCGGCVRTVAFGNVVTEEGKADGDGAAGDRAGG